MNVEIGTKAARFLFREFLLQIFGIVSLQCGRETAMHLIHEISIVKETMLFQSLELAPSSNHQIS
jgi:hypothetical protein